MGEDELIQGDHCAVERMTLLGCGHRKQLPGAGSRSSSLVCGFLYMLSRFLTCVVWLPWRSHSVAASGATVTLGPRGLCAHGQVCQEGTASSTVCPAESSWPLSSSSKAASFLYITDSHPARKGFLASSLPARKGLLLGFVGRAQQSRGEPS